MRVIYFTIAVIQKHARIHTHTHLYMKIEIYQRRTHLKKLSVLRNMRIKNCKTISVINYNIVSLLKNMYVRIYFSEN